MLQHLNIGGRLLPLTPPLVMGILNVTEDSFYDGGQYRTADAIVKRAGEMLSAGADIIDIGAMSTRPGAADISEQEEINRIECAVQNGADMINDVSGGTFDSGMIPTIGQLQVPYCLMHTPAKPDIMQQHTDYQDVIAEMLQFFGQQIEKLHEVHVHDIILDPGFGFGKTLEQNYFVLQNMDAFKVFNLPILVGVSRKSMIYKLLEITPDNALNGTTAVNTIALMKGAHILRVHDVKEAVEVRKIYRSFMS